MFCWGLKLICYIQDFTIAMFVLTSFTVTVEDTELNPMTIKKFSSHDAKPRKLVTNMLER